MQSCNRRTERRPGPFVAQGKLKPGRYNVKTQHARLPQKYRLLAGPAFENQGRVGATEATVPDADLEDYIVSWPLKLPKRARQRR